ncbi:MAG: hypothetical protein GEV03_08050 [Streptosporangiales bacterium]|nr:hypothetical protein [Streptosporangiales bacterium]
MADTYQVPGSSSGRPGDVGRENLALRELIAVYRHLSGLALQNADLATVAQLIAERTTATVAVVSQRMDILAAASPGHTGERAAEYVREVVVHPRLGHVLSATRQTRRALRLPEVGTKGTVIVAPILVGDDVPAYLMTLDSGEWSPGEDVSLLLTEHAATICGVILGRERVVAAAASRVRDDLVEGLLSARGQDEREVRRWAQHLGYDPARDYHVLSVALDAPQAEANGDPLPQRQRASSAIEHFFATRAPDAITSVREAEVVVVLPEPEDSGSPGSPGSSGSSGPPGPYAVQLGERCLTRVRELHPDATVTIGIGGMCRQPPDIARSYAEARRTIDTVRRMGRTGRVVAFDDLGIHRLLLQVPNLTELQGFAREVLGALSSPRDERNAEYLGTLACYFRENNSPQKASRILHVHPNTVTYRIRRVEELTGLDLSNHTDRLMAQVALEILDAVGDAP